MSKSIDEKVVSMKFDNSNFESNVKTSLSTIEKLKQSLNLKGASSGLNEVSAAAKKCDFSSLSDSISTVQVKFSSLQIVGITALQNITRYVGKLASKVVNMFAVEPKTNGFQEYELKMNSVQTIMASTGASLEEVNRYLDELNIYADKTIYSFSDMTNNIGKFTNAGVSLDKAVLAIKGVSNEAAVSGANANEASRAMYNFAQALSAGYVKLIDWKSIENANMATVEFKQQLIDTAVSCGTLTDNLDGTYSTFKGTVISATQNFNDSLQDQWMTTDVLVDTLGDYADETTEIGAKAYASAQDVKTFSMMIDTLREAAGSGWAQTWEIIIGDFEEAKSLWTYLSNIFSNILSGISNVRNNFLESVLGDRGIDAWTQVAEQVEATGVSIDDFKDKLIEVGKEHGVITDEMISEAGSFESSLKSGWLSVDIVAEALGSFTSTADEFNSSTEDMTSKLEYFQDVVNRVWRGDFYNGEERIEALTAAGYEYAEVQELVNKTVDGHALTLEDLGEEQLRSIGYTEEQINKISALKYQAEQSGTSFNKLIEGMSQVSGRTLLLESFKKILEDVGSVLEAVKKGWDKVFGGADLSEPIYNLIKQFHDFIENIQISTDVLDGVTTSVSAFLGTIKLAGTLASPTFGLFTKILGVIQKALGLDFWSLINRLADVVNEYNDWILKNNQIVSTVIDAGNTILNFLESVLSNIKNVLSAFLDAIHFNDYADKLSSGIISSFKNLSKWFVGFAPLVQNFIDTLRSLDEVNFQTVGDAFIDFVKNVLNRILTIGDNFKDLTGTLEALRDNIINYFGGSSQSINAFWGYIKDKLGKLYDLLVKVKNAFKDNFGFAETVTVAAGAVITVVAFKIIRIFEKLASVVFKFSDVIKGAVKVESSLSNMFDAIGKAAKLAAISVIIKNIAVAFLALSGAFLIFSKLDWTEIAKGSVAIIAISIALTVLTFAMTKLKAIDLKNNPLIGATAVIAAIAVSIVLIVAALKIMESLNPEGLIQHCAIILGAIVSLSVAIIAISRMTKNTELTSCALVLVSFAASILLISKAMQSLGNIKNFDDAMIALGAISAVIIVIIAISSLLSSAKSSLASGAMFAGIAATILAMTVAFNVLSNLDPSKMKQGYMALLSFTAMIILLIAISNSASGFQMGTGAMFAGIAVTILAMTVAVKFLGNLSEDEIKNGIITLTSMVVLISVLIIVASKANASSSLWSGLTFVGISFFLLSMTAAMVVLSHLTIEQIIKGIACVTALGLLIMGIEKCMQYVRVTKNGAKALTSIVAVIGVMTVALAVLSTLDPGGLLGAVAALAVLMVSFAHVMRSMSSLQGISIKALAAVVILAMVIAELTVALKILDGADPASSLGSAASLSLLLLALVVAVNALGRVSNNALKGAVAMTIMSVGILAMAAALYVMKDVPIETIIAGVAAFAAVIIVLVAASAIIQQFATGAIVLAALILSISVSLLIGAAAFLVFSIALQICGAALPAIADGVTALGAAISSFITQIAACFSSAGDFAATILTVGASVAAFLIIVAAGMIVAGAGALVLGAGALVAGAGLIVASAGVLALSAAIAVLCAVISAGLQLIVSSAMSIADIASQAGTNVVQGFANGIINGLGSVLTACAGFVSSVVNTICDLLGIHSPSVLAQLWGAYTGEGFAIGLEGSSGQGASAAGGFLNAVAGVFMGDTSASEAASETGAECGEEYSAGVESGVGASGTDMVSTFLANSGVDPTLFEQAGVGCGEEYSAGVESGVGASGTDMVSTFLANSGVDPTLFEQAGVGCGEEYSAGVTEGMSEVSMDDTITQLVDNINNRSSEFNTAGVNLMTEFSNGITTGSETVNTNVSTMLEGISTSFTDSQGAFQSFVSMFDSIISKSDGLVTVSSRVRGISTAVSTARSAFDTFDSVISLANTHLSMIGEIAVSAMSSVSTVVSSAASAFPSLGEAAVSAAESVSSAAAAVVGSAESMSTAMGAVMSSMLATINSESGAFNSAGTALGRAFASGIRSQTNSAYNAGSALGTSGSHGCRGYYSDFYSAGTSCAQGFANGIRDHRYLATNAGSSLGNAAYAAAKRAIDSHSPSKKFMELGDYSAQGFAIGITKNSYLVTKASNTMATDALNTASDVISKIGNVVDSDLDLTPSITPVVDMNSVNASDLQLGANIDAYISDPINNMSQLMTNAQNQINASNNKVVEAVTGLRNDLNAAFANSDQEISLYVDSKKLSSTLVKPMNRQLSVLAKQGGF